MILVVTHSIDIAVTLRMYIKFYCFEFIDRQFIKLFQTFFKGAILNNKSSLFFNNSFML